MLDVSDNKLSGVIPSNLGKCSSMEHLRLGGNQFDGTVPQSLEALRGLLELNLSRNNFSGKIPKFLCKILALKFLDLSYNNFEGEVPIDGIFSNSTIVSISGNKNLCDGLRELRLRPCSANKTLASRKILPPNLLIPIIVTFSFLAVLLCIFFACFMIKKSRKKKALDSSTTKDLVTQMSSLELSKATNGFSTENLVGSGSFGSVYRGILPGDESVVAIKVLNLKQQGASKSFIDECKILSSIRHRNLLKIITSCSSTDEQGNEFKALVFEFMSNGNLDFWLHSADQSKRLSLIKRLSIAIDIANALDYLHNHCETTIVHCDLKPSNVLLDDDMVAHVGDFGLARFLLESSKQTLSFALKGSFGYVPPEYGIGGRISIQGDIYSYGILLLEMIIGKRPTDDSFGDGMDIRQFTVMALPQCAIDIVDPSLLSEEAGQQEEENEDEIAIMGGGERQEVEKTRMEEFLVSVMRIGLCCSKTTPMERMSMNVVVNKLEAVRRSYLKFKKEN